MGERLEQQDGYPVGVSNAHPHFHEPDPADVPCQCGHVYDEHEDGGDECTVCDCPAYEMEEA